MKTIVILLACSLTTAIASGQNRELKVIDVTPPTLTREIPVTINEYLQDKTEFPVSELKTGRKGTVVAGFVVTPEGKLNNIHIINSLSDAIDMEVIRALKTTDGKWSPGVVNGEAVEMSNEVAVIFKLYPEENFYEIAKKHLDKGNQALFIKDQPEKALKHFNKGLILLPNDETLLSARGLCKYKLGDLTGANRDWDRLKTIAERNRTNTEMENLAKIPVDSREYENLFHEPNK